MCVHQKNFPIILGLSMCKKSISKKHPFITLSIISHGDLKKVVALLKGIDYYENAAELQIIITDNLGEDDFRENLPPDILFLRNSSPRGFGYNHNQAFQHARGDYFCVLNPDIVFTEAVFHHLIVHIKKHQADILAPLVVDGDNTIQDSFRDLPTPGKILRRRLLRKTSIEEPIETLSPDWLAGMFLFMRTDTFLKLGGFDKRYHLYFEDVDFCTRARLAGFHLQLQSDLRVQHDAHRGSRSQPKYLLWHLQSAWKFFTSETYRKAK